MSQLCENTVCIISGGPAVAVLHVSSIKIEHAHSRKRQSRSKVRAAYQRRKAKGKVKQNPPLILHATVQRSDHSREWKETHDMIKAARRSLVLCYIILSVHSGF